MTRIELETGYINPYENQEVLVELKNGTITGAKFICKRNTPLEDSSCYIPLGVPCNVFLSPVVAYYVGEFK